MPRTLAPANGKSARNLQARSFFFRTSPRAMAKGLPESIDSRGLEEAVRKLSARSHAHMTIQLLNGSELAISQALRDFLEDYSTRCAHFGIQSLPSSFNVAEAFFSFIPHLGVFTLRPEIEHNFDMWDFIEWITHPDSTYDISTSMELLAAGTIYSYNNSGRLRDYLINTSTGKEFAFEGAALIHDGAEATIMMLLGEKADIEEETKRLKQSDAHPIDYFQHRDYIKETIVDGEPQAVPLRGNSSFWKVVLLTRVDMASGKMQARYILHDNGIHYSVITDDSAIYGPSLKNEARDQLKQIIEGSTADLKVARPLFEVALLLLSVPQYFKAHEDKTTQELMNTPYSREINNAIYRGAFKLVGADLKRVAREVTVLPRISKGGLPDEVELFSEELKLERDGFWKPLPPDAVGSDRNGKPIAGKTWVTRHLSWIENIPASPVSFSGAKKRVDGPNSGWIYVMRCAAHSESVYKVGMTKREVRTRSLELSRETSAPDKFDVMQKWWAEDCVRAERIAHKMLAPYRLTDNREFFKAEYAIIRAAIEDAVGDEGVE